MSVVVFAYHDVGIAGIRMLLRLGIEIRAVYTHEDDPTEERWFGSVRDLCRELDLPVHVGANPNLPEELDRIRSLRPRALFSFWYRRILKEPLLAVPTSAAVNLHGSLLPRYRGRSPVNWQILHGERESAATLHHMVRKPDAGDIIGQEPFPIDDDDTPTDVYRKLVAAEERVLERSALAVVEGTAPRYRQLETNATVCGGRRPEDGRIDWRHCARDVRNLVRAVTRPYPGAFTFTGERRLLVWWAEHEASGAERRPAAPGTVHHERDGVHVTCGEGRSLRLVRVELDAGVIEGAGIADALADGSRLGDPVGY